MIQLLSKLISRVINCYYKRNLYKSYLNDQIQLSSKYYPNAKRNRLTRFDHHDSELWIKQSVHRQRSWDREDIEE